MGVQHQVFCRKAAKFDVKSPSAMMWSLQELLEVLLMYTCSQLHGQLICQGVVGVNV